MWREWSPTWRFTPALYAQTAAAFDNPDFVGCVIHSYRHRNFNAEGEARFIDTERRLATRPPVAVPTIVLHGSDDSFGAPAAAISAGERTTFPRLVDKRIIAGAGHFVPHEKPEPVAEAIIDVIQKS
jgi:pimeloyl-ACP methyl ester carboxylesterase